MKNEFRVIADLIEKNKKVLDVGCADGTLMKYLKDNKNINIGKKAIVTIPNFGFWKVRFHLLFKGTMPITKALPDEWYSTPNLHMCTIKDFVYFVKSRDIKIFKSLALNNLNSSLINENNLGIKNLFADLGIFLIEK